MKTLKFKCTLLSDVILNQKAATEGPNQTLDFISGSCFLGIAASTLYTAMNEKTMEIFHSGKVRFGDAHPSKDNHRGLKVPASMFYPKLKKPSEELYIHHLIPEKILEDEKFKTKQIKQCRSGFYTFADTKATEVKTETNFAIKSAYDKEKRRSKDEQMYGYQSLKKGLELLFEVEVDNDKLADEIKSALCGERRIGRSRTAQYGLVEIMETVFDKVKTVPIDKNIVTVYADGRLIFLDEFGLPTFRPTAEALGLYGGEILWDKSQIRTFQYAPWNYQRQCFDADRCGIEKGSVFVVDVTNCKDSLDLKSKYLGFYNNEGFGKVIYNPEFLAGDGGGIAKYKLCDAEKKGETDKKELKGTPLLDFIRNQQDKENIETEVYKMVNDWVRNNQSKFRGDTFASQWGAIRSIAMKHPTKNELQNELFEKTTSKNGKTIQNAYLTHGVASEKWRERGRYRAFKEFFDELTVENAQMAVINLAAEMAKKCKEDK